MSYYIDERVFEELLNNDAVKIICEAPVGSCKSTAIKKFIQNQITKSIHENEYKYKFNIFVIVLIQILTSVSNLPLI